MCGIINNTKISDILVIMCSHSRITHIHRHVHHSFILPYIKGSGAGNWGCSIFWRVAGSVSVLLGNLFCSFFLGWWAGSLDEIMYILAYTHTYITYIHTYIHIHSYRIHIFIHTYIHTYIHAYTYIHTHIHTAQPLFFPFQHEQLKPGMAKY